MFRKRIPAFEPNETVVRLGAGLGIAIKRELDGGRLFGNLRNHAAELAEFGLGAHVIIFGVQPAEDFADVGAAVFIKAFADGVDRFAVLRTEAFEDPGEGATGGISIEHG
jgi:hypothetical protein